MIKAGGTFEHLFSREGTYPYFSRLDKKLKGTVVVRPVK